RIADIIMDHIGAEALTIHNLSVLTDADIAHDQDYFSLMEDNLKVLDTAIGEERHRMKTPVIAMKHVSYAYEHKNVLQNVNFELTQGSFLGLVGPNGGGKTTLIKLILGLLKPDSGSIYLFNQPMATFKNWHKIGYVSQKSNAFNKG